VTLAKKSTGLRALALGALVLGCYGAIDGGGAGPRGEPAVPGASARVAHDGVSGLVRLTNAQYVRTVTDLVGVDPTAAGTSFPRDGVGSHGYVAMGAVTALEADRFLRSAEEVASAAAPALRTGLPCDLDADASCVSTFVRDFGHRALRRPLLDDEVVALVAPFTVARTEWGYGADEALAVVVATLLVQPEALYRTQLGDGPGAPGASVALGAHELASRLSYFVWGTAPDPALLALADRGAILEPARLEAEARRLLADPRSEDGLGDMFVYWLGVQTLAEKGKTAEVHPAWNDALAAAMITEIRSVALATLREEGTLDALLTTRRAYVTPELAEIYGVTHPTGSGAAWVDLADPDRRGLLTRAAFLATHSLPAESSPIRRGKIVRTRLMCDVLPPPPANAMLDLPTVDPLASTREKTTILTSPTSCQSCHALINPVGFAFERFDAVGRRREVEHGQPIDATGFLEGSDVERSFDGSGELTALLAESERVERCFVTELFRFGTERLDTAGDAPLLDALADDFVASGGDLRELVIAFVTSEAFTHYQVP
jgi:hypothetical protein